MTFSKSLLLGLAMVSLAACQTTSAVTAPSDLLLAGIDTSSVSGTQMLSGNNVTCMKFYENTATFASLPMANITGSVPSTPSFGSSLMRTVVLGTLAGVASGGVAALGIGSSFAEAAAIGTASQVTYNMGGTVYDNIVTKEPELPAVPAVPEVPALTPMQEIAKAAAALGCPAPDQAAIAALQSTAG